MSTQRRDPRQPNKRPNRANRPPISRQSGLAGRAGMVSVIAVVVLLLAGMAGWAIYQSQQPGDYEVPANAEANGAALVDGDGPVRVDIWLDFHCPHCVTFEQHAAPLLDQLVDDGTITRVYHPVSLLDRASTTNFSTRASASAACAADGDSHPAYVQQLLAVQPDQGGPGLSDDELIQVGGSVGLSDPAFEQCIRDGDYRGWTSHITAQASRAGVNSTPTVRVDGEDVPAQPAAVEAAVQQAADN